jgi:hypothetical protein
MYIFIYKSNHKCIKYIFFCIKSIVLKLGPGRSTGQTGNRSPFQSEHKVGSAMLTTRSGSRKPADFLQNRRLGHTMNRTGLHVSENGKLNTKDGEEAL